MVKFLNEENNKITGSKYRTYELKCINEPENKQYGRDLIKVGELYECTTNPASNWSELYSVKIGGVGVEVPKECFEPLKYILELWIHDFTNYRYDTDSFEDAKEVYLKLYNSYDKDLKGCTDFKVDKESMSIEWKYEHLLGLNFKELLEQGINEAQRALSEI